MTHSTAKKPKKPHKDFPLSWHPQGYWCKKIRGTVHYFGPRYAEPDTALEEYLRVKDDLLAGREPRATTDGLTVRVAEHR